MVLEYYKAKMNYLIGLIRFILLKNKLCLKIIKMELFIGSQALQEQERQVLVNYFYLKIRKQNVRSIFLDGDELRKFLVTSLVILLPIENI